MASFVANVALPFLIVSCYHGRLTPLQLFRRPVFCDTISMHIAHLVYRFIQRKTLIGFTVVLDLKIIVS